MRTVAETLLLLAVMLGLTLPQVAARPHDAPCGAVDECGDACHDPCTDASECNDGAPTVPCDCESHEEPSPDAVQQNEDTPKPAHHHHHHHHCVCLSANGWLISAAEAVYLHPPLSGALHGAMEHLFVPDSPVMLLDRPPAS